MPAHQPLDTETLEAFEAAQRDAIRVLGATLRELKEGQSEAEIVELAKKIGADHGYTSWYHEPEARIGGRLDRFYRASTERRLSPGALLEIDLGPAHDQAYGDTGMAMNFGDEPGALAQGARELCRATCGFASRWKTVGELFVFANAWTINHRQSLGDARAVGHVCLSREGIADLAWPTSARAATLMRRNQIQWYNPRRLAGLYAVRPRLVSGDQGAAFEEMIYVDGDVKRILGRAGLDEVGSF
jgi:hypothetical protein